MDRDAFEKLAGPHRRELLAHCYRMLGSVQDAEDVLQETLLAAWQGFPAYEGRASPRTWLYRIATNRCLNARRDAARRPPAAWTIPGVEPPEPTRVGEVTWLEPYPEAHYEQAETISLAFVTVLQTLPPRQTAVLVLRDVLGFPAADVASMLDTTTDSVNSLLKRARARVRPLRSVDPPPPPGSPAERELLSRFVRAYQDADLDALVALLTDDAFIAMPPMPFEYEGRDAVAGFFDRLFRAGRRFHLVPSRANGQPAYAARLHTPDGPATGLIVLTLTGDRIHAMTHFEARHLASFSPGDR